MPIQAAGVGAKLTSCAVGRRVAGALLSGRSAQAVGIQAAVGVDRLLDHDHGQHLIMPGAFRNKDDRHDAVERRSAR